MSKEITMQDIASMLGISKVTVSKALNNKDGVGQELRKKILDIAEKYNYHLPQKVKAEALIGKKVAVFCSDKYFDTSDSGYFYIKIYTQITEELAKKDIVASLLTVKENMDYQSLKSFLYAQEFDGIILLGNLPRRFSQFLGNIDIPLVFVDSDRGVLDGDSVIIENFYSTYNITKYLIENGHRQIGFIGTINTTQSINDRYLGFCRAMMERELPICREWIIDDRTKENTHREMDLPRTLPTAFVCNCDFSAYHFEKLLIKNGMRVPEDVSIVSFDNDSFAEISPVPLTTVSINIDDMVQKVVFLLIERIQGTTLSKNLTQMVDTDIIYRGSVRSIL